MSKKKSWLCLINRFFFPKHHHHHQQQKRSKRRRWPFGRLKRTKGLPPPPPQPQPPPPPPPPVSRCNDEVPKSPECIKVGDDVVVLLHHQREKGVESLAVIKIQTAYRGYLARKALRALKGFVKLQAIIRGRAVRRQAMTTLKCLQAIVSIQSEVCTKRGQMALDKYKDLRLKGLHHHDNLEMEINRYTRMDDGLLPKEEEIDNIILRKKEAILRKQRSKPYSSNQKISTDSSEEGETEGRLRYWLEKYVNDQVLSTKDSKTGLKHLKLKNTECLNNLSLARRSFHTGLNPGGPPTTPAYMAATESARAKARSTSTPRPRPVLVDRAYSDGEYSPYKHRLSLRLSPMSSTRSEMTCSGFGNKCLSNSQHKSPSLKGVSGPVISSKKMKE